MSNPKYKDIGEPEDWVMEECGELIQAIAKAKRFGIESYHPVTLVRNTDRILSEMQDVEEAIRAYRTRLIGGSPVFCLQCENLRGALSKYGKHLDQCGVMRMVCPKKNNFTPDAKCMCGLDNAKTRP